jgi:hypothetical protein
LSAKPSSRDARWVPHGVSTFGVAPVPPLEDASERGYAASWAGVAEHDGDGAAPPGAALRGGDGPGVEAVRDGLQGGPGLTLPDDAVDELGSEPPRAAAEADALSPLHGERGAGPRSGSSAGPRRRWPSTTRRCAASPTFPRPPPARAVCGTHSAAIGCDHPAPPRPSGAPQPPAGERPMRPPDDNTRVPILELGARSHRSRPTAPCWRCGRGSATPPPWRRARASRWRPAVTTAWPRSWECVRRHPASLRRGSHHREVTDARSPGRSA